MDEQCSKPTCDIRASYTFNMSPGSQVVYRCTFHMAMEISKLNLANSELRTIQKVD